MELRVVNKSEKETEIDIEGVIGWDDEASWRNIKKQLLAVANSNVSKIIVNINSLGGFVNDGLMIHDALRASKAQIETRVYSMSASAATVIAQAGDKRKMSANALYLVHHAMNAAWGNVFEMEAAIKDLKKVDEVLTNIYLKKGADEAKLRELMDDNNGNGRWIDAEEALEAGLIDEIIEPSKAAAFTQAERNIFDQYHLPPIPEKYMSKKSFFQQAVDVIKNFGKTEEEIAAAEAAEAEAAAQAETEQAETEEQETAEEAAETVQEAETDTEAGETSTEGAEGQETEENEEEEETEEEEEEEEAEDTAQTENAQLKETIQQLNSRIEALTSQLNDVQSKLSKAAAKSTKPRGVVGREGDETEDLNVPFMKEVKALDENFMLGKPLANPKPRKETKTE